MPTPQDQGRRLLATSRTCLPVVCVPAAVNRFGDGAMPPGSRLGSAARDGTRTTGSCREEAIHQSAQSPQEVRKTSEDGRFRSSVANDISAGQPKNWTLGRRSANQPDGPPEAGAQVRILPGAPFRISCTADLLVHARWYRRPSWVCPGHAGSDGEEATMTISPDDDVSAPTTDDGTPVGTADAAEDARRAGADRDTNLRDPVVEGALRVDDENRPTDDGVPIGEADAEADRARAFGDDERP